MKIKNLKLGKKLISIVAAGTIMFSSMPTFANAEVNYGNLPEVYNESPEYFDLEWSLIDIFCQEFGFEDLSYFKGFGLEINEDNYTFTFGVPNKDCSYYVVKRINELLSKYGLEYSIIEPENFDEEYHNYKLIPLNMHNLTQSEIDAFHKVKFYLEDMGRDPKEDNGLLSQTSTSENDEVTVRLIFPNVEKYGNPQFYFPMNDNSSYMDEYMGYNGLLNYTKRDTGFTNLTYTKRIIPGYSRYVSDFLSGYQYAENITSPIIAAQMAESINSTGKYTAFVTKYVTTSGEGPLSNEDFVIPKDVDTETYLIEHNYSYDNLYDLSFCMPSGKYNKVEDSLDDYNIRYLPRISYFTNKKDYEPLLDNRHGEVLEPITVNEGINEVDLEFNFSLDNMFLYWIKKAENGTTVRDRTKLLPNNEGDYFTCRIEDIIDIFNEGYDNIPSLYLRANLTNKEAADLYVKGMKNSKAFSNVNLKVENVGTESIYYGGFTFEEGTGLFTGLDKEGSINKAKEYVNNWAKSHLDRIDYSLNVLDNGDGSLMIQVYLLMDDYIVTGTYKSSSNIVTPVLYRELESSEKLYYHEDILEETGFKRINFRSKNGEVTYAVVVYDNDKLNTEYVEDGLVEYTVTYKRQNKEQEYEVSMGEYPFIGFENGNCREIEVIIPKEKTKSK